MSWKIHGREYATEAEVLARFAELDDEAGDGPLDPAQRDEWGALGETASEIRSRHEMRAAAFRGALGGRQGYADEGWQRTTYRRDDAADDAPAHVAQARDAGLRIVDAHVRSGALDAAGSDRLDQHLRADRAGIDGRYLAAVGDPAYNSAFGKLLQHGSMAPLRFTPEEQQAVQAVNAAQHERALAEGVGSTGGFAVPFALDPTIMNTSSGAISPLREVARQITLAGTNEWRGISSAGASSNYGAEGSEVNDDAPTLAQPSILAQRWTSFVPFSIEIDQDWRTLQTDLAVLMRDSKDVLDATKFALGTGVNEPGGILNVGGVGGLTTGQRIQTATVATTAIADVYSLKNSLPPRFQPGASYLAAGATIDVVYRFVAAGSTTEPALVGADRTSILGKPLRELSTLATTTTTTGSKIMIYADFRQAFAVVDRLGVQVELVNHLFGVNRRPTGQRGLLAIGRTGSGVVNASAARYLEVK